MHPSTSVQLKTLPLHGAVGGTHGNDPGAIFGPLSHAAPALPSARKIALLAMDQTAAKKTLHELIRREDLGNRACVDCGNPNPQWASGSGPRTTSTVSHSQLMQSALPFSSACSAQERTEASACTSGISHPDQPSVV